MNVKEYTVLKILSDYNNKNLFECTKELKEFNSVLIDLTDILHSAKVNLNLWQADLEIHLVKFALHTASYLHLIDGTTFKGRKQVGEIKYPDLGSLYLIRRALIENYLMFYYLNIQPISKDDAELRYYLYKLSGLSHRQKYDAKYSEHISKQNHEKLEIDNLIGLIKNNTEFNKYPLSRQRELMKRTPARIFGWEELIKLSHLKTEMFLDIWKLYSNHAHSEMIGAMQLKEYLQNRKSLDAVLYHSTVHNVILSCILITDIVTMFKAAEITFNTLPEPLRITINYWAEFGKRS